MSMPRNKSCTINTYHVSVKSPI